MRFKIDENLPQETAQLLNESGHEAATVFGQALSGEKDPALLEVCRTEGRVLVTLDLDFANIQAYPPASTNGIVVLRLVRQDKPWVLEMMGRSIPFFENHSLSGKLWVVEDDCIRIRGQ